MKLHHGRGHVCCLLLVFALNHCKSTIGKLLNTKKSKCNSLPTLGYSVIMKSGLIPILNAPDPSNPSISAMRVCPFFLIYIFSPFNFFSVTRDRYSKLRSYSATSEARHVGLGVTTAAAAAAVHRVQSRIRSFQARNNGTVALRFDIVDVVSDDIGRATLSLATHVFVFLSLFQNMNLLLVFSFRMEFDLLLPPYSEYWR